MIIEDGPCHVAITSTHYGQISKRNVCFECLIIDQHFKYVCVSMSNENERS